MSGRKYKLPVKVDETFDNVPSYEHPRKPRGRSWGGREPGASGNDGGGGRGEGAGRKELFSPLLYFSPPPPPQVSFPLAPVTRPPHDLPLGFRG